jgi:hypothetical protein
MENKKYKKNPEIIEKANGNNLLLFNVNSGRMMELNITAKLLWEKSEDTMDFNSLKKIVLENCIVDSGINHDIEEFIKSGMEKQVIIEDGKN